MSSRAFPGPEEIRELLARWRERRDTEARDALLASVEPYVRRVARKIAGPNKEAARDYLHEGLMAALHALELFDVDRGPSLLFYVSLHVRQRIARYAAETRSDVTAPPQLALAAHRMDRLGEDVESIATQLHVRPETVVAVLGISCSSFDVEPANAPGLAKTVASDDISAEAAAIWKEQIERARAIAADRRLFTPDESYVLLNLLADEPLTLAELGRRRGRSHAWASLVRNKAIGRFAAAVREELPAKAPQPARPTRPRLVASAPAPAPCTRSPLPAKKPITRQVTRAVLASRTARRLRALRAEELRLRSRERNLLRAAPTVRTLTTLHAVRSRLAAVREELRIAAAAVDVRRTGG